MSYDAFFKRLELQALFDIKGRIEHVRSHIGEMATGFPDSPNTFKAQGSSIVYFLGPDHWLLRADLKQEDELLLALSPDDAPEEVSIVHVSDTLAFFEVVGHQAEDVMAVATPLDIRPEAFPPDGATFTEAFGVKALVSRKAGGGFELAFDWSFQEMISVYLREILS